MKDFKKLPYHFSNESSEVRSHLTHLGAQVLLELQPVGSQGHHSVREALDVDQVDGRDVHACRDTGRATGQLGDGEGLQRACAGWMCLLVSPDRIRSEESSLCYRFMRELLCPPVLSPGTIVGPRWAKKGQGGV